MKKLVILSLLAGLAACGKGGSSGSTGGTETVRAESNELSTSESQDTVEANSSFKVTSKRKVLLHKDLSNLEEFKDKINSHTIGFEATSGHFTNAWIDCRRAFFDGSKDVFTGYFDKSGLKAEVTIDLSQRDPSEVKFECTLNSVHDEPEKVSVTLLKSYVLSGKANTAATIGADKFGTLLLDKDAVLITNGADVDLNMQELISADGKLITFEQNKVDTTNDNRAGASGGSIKITTEKAFGRLNVELRGLNAGKQINVPDKETRIPPANPKNNGIPGSGYDSCPSCKGKPGDRGYQGKKGFQGFPGGDAGTLQLIVSGENSLVLDVKHFPGKGGQGGVGGEGGLGGPGGKGAVNRYWEPNGCIRCGMEGNKAVNEWISVRYPDGPQGPKGIQGEQGDEGPAGQIQESRFVLKKINQEHVFNFDWKNFN